MANTTITNLPLATSINGTEQIPAVQSSATVRLTVNQLVSFTSSTLPAPVVTIGGAVSGGTANNALYVSPSGTLGQFPYGTGVLNAIQIATGTNGAMVLLNGDAGTPTSLVLTNATGTPASIGLNNANSLPIAGITATGTPSASTFLRGDSTWAPIVLTVGTTAISGATNGYLLYNNGGTLGSVAPTAASLSIGSPITGGTSGYGLYVDASTQLGQFAYGTGVRTALGVAVGSAGAPVLFNGAGGTPTSLVLTNATGTPTSIGLANATALSLPIGSISATGTPSASTYLRGDGSWAAAGGGGVTVNTGVTNQLSYYSGASAISGNDKATIIGGALTIGIQSNTAGSIVLANTNVAARSTTIQSSASASAAWTLTLPVSAGSSTNVLSTDGTGVTSWVAASVGTVTSVGLTVATGAGGILSNSGSTSPITGSGTYTLAVTGTQGGIPYFSSTTAWASSGALTLNGVVYGGGAGASPASTAAGTTGQVLIATTSAAPSWGQVSLTAGVTGSLPIGNGGTGQTTTALGTIVVGASGSTTTNLAIGTTGQILTVSGGTATWQNAASGGVSTITFGSTGLTPATATSGAVSVAGTLNAGFGGTGLATLTANSVLLGNGTSAVQLIAPSTAGNVLTSDGTTWASATPSSAGVPTGTIVLGPGATYATTAANSSAGTATVTYGGTYAIPVGSTVTISGVTPSGFNGSYTVTASSAGSVSFANATAGPQTVAGSLYMTPAGYLRCDGTVYLRSSYPTLAALIGTPVSLSTPTLALTGNSSQGHPVYSAGSILFTSGTAAANSSAAATANAVYTSSDGVTWTLRTGLNIQGLANQNDAVAYNGSAWVGCADSAYAGSQTACVIHTSSIASGFTKVALTGAAINSGVVDICYGGSGNVFVVTSAQFDTCSNNYTNGFYIHTSTNGTSWTSQTVPTGWTSARVVGSAAYSGGVVLCTSQKIFHSVNGASPYADITTNVLGSATVGTISNGIMSISYANSRFIMVVGANTTVAGVYTSTTGASGSWTKLATSAVNPLNVSSGVWPTYIGKIRWNGSVYVHSIYTGAGGPSNTILFYSLDLINWFGTTISFGNTFGPIGPSGYNVGSLAVLGSKFFGAVSSQAGYVDNFTRYVAATKFVYSFDTPGYTTATQFPTPTVRGLDNSTLSTGPIYLTNSNNVFGPGTPNSSGGGGYANTVPLIKT